MNKTILVLGLLATTAVGCSTSTVRSTQLAQGADALPNLQQIRLRLGMTF
ncbi:MAG: hypothetical protein VXZ16_00640 [Bacteroidota bacterium]|nr:hypothetical protein [Bacteroidota bacterium]